jgi:hypothetical protein
VYAGAPSAGSPAKDFANDWNEFVVKPFKAAPGPKTQTQPAAEGWQAVVGGASIELDGGVKATAILTVFSGFNKTASVLVIFNDESYSNQASALIAASILTGLRPKPPHLRRQLLPDSPLEIHFPQPRISRETARRPLERIDHDGRSGR